MVEVNLQAVVQAVGVALLGAIVKWLATFTARMKRLEKQIGNGPTPLNERLAVIEAKQNANAERMARIDDYFQSVLERREP